MIPKGMKETMPTGGSRIDEEMRSFLSSVTGTDVPLLSKDARSAAHRKKNDDAYVPASGDWTTTVDDAVGNDDSPHSPAGRRGKRRPSCGQAPGGISVSLNQPREKGPATNLRTTAVKVLDEAKRLGAERAVLMLLTAATIVTGILCTLSVPMVFYNNHVFNTWKSVSPSSTGTVDPSQRGENGDNVTMPHIPPQLVSIERALLWFGSLAIVVGVVGFTAARERKITAWICAYVVAAAVLSLACLFTVSVASFRHYFANGEAELNSQLRKLWYNLEERENKVGHPALCELQGKFKCSGFSVCCATNSSEVPQEELMAAGGLPGSAWESLCFLTLANGTRLDRHGGDVTMTVSQQCGHMISTDQLPSAVTSNSADSSREMVALVTSQAQAVTGTSPFSDSLSCRLPAAPSAGQLETVLSPCRDVLIGNLTASIGFTFCALFTLFGFCSVGAGFAISIILDAFKRPTSSVGFADDDAFNAVPASVEFSCNPRESSCSLSHGNQKESDKTPSRLLFM